MTAEQFERLKTELETSFQGARTPAGRCCSKAASTGRRMSLSPRDIDFMEAKHAAAREIALAIGVPPMLLGIPGDNTYANYGSQPRLLAADGVAAGQSHGDGLRGLARSSLRAGSLALPDLDHVEAPSPDAMRCGVFFFFFFTARDLPEALLVAVLFRGTSCGT